MIDENQITGLLAAKLYELLPTIYLMELGGERFDVEDARLDPDQLLVLVRKEDKQRFSIEIDVIVDRLAPLEPKEE